MASPSRIMPSGADSEVGAFDEAVQSERIVNALRRT
jgi:hypothetical protein